MNRLNLNEQEFRMIRMIWGGMTLNIHEWRFANKVFPQHHKKCTWHTLNDKISFKLRLDLKVYHNCVFIEMETEQPT